MKKTLILFLFLFIQSCFAQSIVRIALGNTYYTGKINVRENVVSQSGATLSFYFPLYFSVVDAHLKMGVSRHSAASSAAANELIEELRVDKLYNCVNEVLVGKAIALNERFSFLPQFGFGALGELFTYAEDWREAHVDLFVDASFLLNVEWDLLSAGLLFNIEKDFGWSERPSNGLRFRSQIVFGF